MSTSAYIRQQIVAQEEQLSSLRRKGSELEERLANLYRLRNGFDEVRSSFDRKQGKRTSIIAMFTERRTTSRIARLYQDGMQALLQGPEFKSANNGLGEGAQRIQSSIDATVRQIDDNNAQVAAKRRQIDNLYQQLRNAQTQEAAEATRS